MKRIRGLGCIYGRRNVVNEEVKLLLLWLDFKQLYGSFNFVIEQRLDYVDWRIIVEILQAVGAALLVTELS